MKERALLQGRLERIPYKQIGARIGKTDLACRLHFHQMVMAKRTPETAPGRSIVFLSSEHPPEVHRLAPTHSSVTTSTALSSICNPNGSPGSRSEHLSPNLYREPMHRRSYSSPFIDHDRFPGWQPVSSPYPSVQTCPSMQTSPSLLASPNFHTSEQIPSTIDLRRLNNIYREHANDFWSTIAAKYSGGTSLSPSRLEQAFLQGQTIEEHPQPEIPRITLSSSVPPETTTSTSPETSPDIIQAREFSHFRSRSDTSSIAGKCSVESLLNHGKT